MFDLRLRIMNSLFLTALLICFLTVGFGGEKQVKRKDVPTAVIGAFEKAYPNATIKGYSKETENGKTFYEVESKEGSVGRDLLYNVDGTVAEVEETISETDLPQAVRDAIATNYKKAEFRSAEKTTEGEIIKYEVRLKIGKKVKEVLFDGAGKIVK